MNDFIKSINFQLIENVTGESKKVIRQWKKGTRQVPESAIRLLKLFVEGKADELLGKDWGGYFSRMVYYTFLNGVMDLQLIKLDFCSGDHNKLQV